MIEGVEEVCVVFLAWVRSELRRECDRPSVSGGGDLSLGEMGQWGVESPELVPDAVFWGRGTRDGSCTDIGGRFGVEAEDNARWMAAADGTVVLEPARAGPLLGLTSVLLLRDRRPDCFCRVPDVGAFWRCVVR